MKNQFDCSIFVIGIFILCYAIGNNTCKCADKNNPYQGTNKESKRIEKISVHAVPWDILYDVALNPVDILKMKTAFNAEITDIKLLQLVMETLEKFRHNAYYFGKGCVDVRARFDCYYSDKTVDVVCFEEPYVLSINEYYYWDPEGELQVFGKLLPESLGSRFFEKHTDLIFDFESGEIIPKQKTETLKPCKRKPKDS
jgi:hypothetical protein